MVVAQLAPAQGEGALHLRQGLLVKAELVVGLSDGLAQSRLDYRLVGDYKLRRRNDGDNPETSWGAEVSVVYVPEIDQTVRDRVTLDLCQMDIEFQALDRLKSGDYEGEQKDYKLRRLALFRQIREGMSPIA